MKKRLVVLTGAGISAESGIKTFRDADGLWEGHDIYEVASPEGFYANPELVLDFYNQRRRQLLSVSPNKAHKNLVTLETYFDVNIITQNVDDLHERAGSKNVIHVVVPYANYQSILGEHTSKCYNIGFAKNKEDLLTISSVGEKKSIRDDIVKIFRNVEKPTFSR